MFEVGSDIMNNSSIGAGAGGGKSGRSRLRFIYGIFIALFILFIGKTLFLGIQGTNRARIDAGAGEWESSRADIVDRNGEILAKNVVSGHIILRPQNVKDRDKAAALIHSTMPEISVSQALKYMDSDRRYIVLKELASEPQRVYIKDAKVAGIDIEKAEWRRYPKHRLTSHIVGFVGKDMNGLEGMERIRNDYLSQNKDPLVLSIDSRIQGVFYQKLVQAMQTYGAKAAMGMMMNSRTGEMLAMVSLPDFDPENIDADPASNRMFVPLRGVFEMGSIFKIFNTAMAIETGIGLAREYPIEKVLKVMDARITDVSSFKPPRPRLNVAEIMLYSCNVGSAQIALDLPSGTQKEFFSRVRFDRSLNLEFGKTEHPMMPRKWGPVERATISFGHGISVTPMHVLLAVNAMVNGGIYVEPTIIKRSIGTVSGERVVSPEVSDSLRKIMFKIAENGTAKSIKISGINIGGKTATAEKWVNGQKDKKKNLTAFIGAFPIESPQYTIFVILDEPHGTEKTWGWRTAAWNAVPTAREILDSVLPILYDINNKSAF